MSALEQVDNGESSVATATLTEWLAAAPRSYGERLEVVVLVGQELLELHRRGLCHGHLSARCIHVDADHRVVMADHDAALPPDPTARLPPESTLGESPGAFWDQFSFATLAWYLLVEPGSSAPLESATPRVRRALRRAMSPLPEERWPSLDMLLVVLRGGRRRPVLWLTALMVVAAVLAIYGLR